MGETLVTVENVSKKFCRYLSRSMLYGMVDISRNLIGMGSNPEKLREHEFWAVDDVSFELKRGECLGIIGANGSGKSTLLKMLNGIFMPDRGKIEIQGKVGALIELGAGFHPMLTGRENIFVNGAILGMSRKETESKFDDIVEFADIGDFLGTPVKNYSSGMLVRLGFAIAIHLRPDIFLIDEVLSVGDAGFQQKCIQRINEFKNNGGTAVFVSHNLMSVQAICDRAIWLDKSRTKTIGAPSDAIDAYLNDTYDRQPTPVAAGMKVEPLPTKVTITRVVSHRENGEQTSVFDFGEDIVVEIQYQCFEAADDAFFGLSLWKNGVEVFHTNMLLFKPSNTVKKGSGSVICRLEEPRLSPGEYEVMGWIQRATTAEMGQKYYHHPNRLHRLVVSRQSFAHQMAFSQAVDLNRLPALWCKHNWS